MSDSPRFDSTAPHYASHRPGYGDAVVDHLVDRFSLGDDAHILDVGSGTGELAVPLAPHADEVVAMDPSPAMLDAARNRAASAGVENAQFVCGDDTNVGEHLGSFRLTAMGRSFHWMHGDATLDRVRSVTASDGGVALVSDTEWLTKGVEPWQAVVYAVAAEFLDDLPERTGPVEYDQTWADQLRGVGFADVQIEAFDDRRELDADAVVGYVLSLSFCSPEQLGDDREAFESVLRERLAEMGGQFAYERDVEVVSGYV